MGIVRAKSGGAWEQGSVGEKPKFHALSRSLAHSLVFSCRGVPVPCGWLLPQGFPFWAFPALDRQARRIHRGIPSRRGPPMPQPFGAGLLEIPFPDLLPDQNAELAGFGWSW